MRFTLITGLIASGLISLTCVAQTPYCNLYWEVNDGSGWTRNQLVTSQRTVLVRYLAEWDAPGAGAYFAFLNFDGTINQARLGDSVSLIARGPTFGQFSSGFSSIMVSSRFNNLIKIDSQSDVAMPGVGSGWIESDQNIDYFGLPVNYSRAISLFSYSLELDGTPVTREISSIARVRPGDGSTVLILGPGNGVAYRLFAPSQGVQVTYVPSPTSAALLLFGVMIPRRRRT